MECDMRGFGNCTPPLIADPISIFTHVHQDDQVVVEVHACAHHGQIQATFLSHYAERTPGLIWRAVTQLL